MAGSGTSMLLALVVLMGTSINELSASKQTFPFRPPLDKESCTLLATFDMSGLRGNISFHQSRANKPVQISVNIDGLDQFNDTTYAWHVHEYPVTFGLRRDSPCSQAEVGGHYDPLNRASSPSYDNDCRNNKVLCEVGDFAGKFGPLMSSRSEYTFVDENLDLRSSFSPLGRSIVIHHAQADGTRFACGNIDYDGNTQVETFRAAFPNPPIQGDIILKRSVGKPGVTLHAELFRVDNEPINMALGWSLRAGNINPDGSCSSLRQVYGSNTHPNSIAAVARCSNQRQKSCFIGDLNQKCGRLNFDNTTRRAKHFCTDIQLGFFNPESFLSRPIVIEAPDGTILACSRFERIFQESALATLTAAPDAFPGTVNTNIGQVYFFQNDPHELTTTRIYLRVAPGGDDNYFQIREGSVTTAGDCNNVGAVFEPIPNFTPPGLSSPIVTGERVLTGDLRTKWGGISGTTTRRNSYLPLFGPLNIIGRALVLFRSNGVPIACGNIERRGSIPEPNIASILGYHIL